MIVTMLLFASLLLATGCGGEQASAPDESAPEITTSSEEVASEETSSETTGAQPGTPEASIAIINSAGERVPLMVELANTPAERTRGLMERTELGENAGMLFVFDEEQELSFWMKNTRIPLSIAYIDSEGRIVDIQDMEPLDETPVPSAEPAQYALEVNQGFFAENGIEVGNVLE